MSLYKSNLSFVGKVFLALFAVWFSVAMIVGGVSLFKFFNTETELAAAIKRDNPTGVMDKYENPPKTSEAKDEAPIKSQKREFDYTYYELERKFLVDLKGSKKVMSVQIAIMTRYDERVVENIKKHDFALRAAIMDSMRMTTEADLAKPDFRPDLAKKIAVVMNTLLEKYEDFGGIEEVNFTDLSIN